MLEWVDEWGRRLLSAAVVYTVVAMVVTASSYAAGAEPPPLVPSNIAALYGEAYRSWSQVSGSVFNASALGVVKAAFYGLDALFNGVIGVMFTLAGAFVWMAYSVASYLPRPLDILSVPVWVAAWFANLVLMLYLVKLVYGILSRILGLGSTLASSY